MKNKYIFSLMFAILLFALLTLISTISFSLISSAGTIRQFRGFWTVELYNRVNFFYSLLVIFTLNDVFSLNNPYLKAYHKGNGGKLGFILKSPCFLIEYAVSSLLVAVFPFVPPYINLSNGFFSDLDTATKYLLTLSVMLPTVFLIKLASYYSTLSWWLETGKRTKSDNKGLPTVAAFMLKLFLTSVIAVVGSFAVSMIFPMFFSTVSVLGTLKLTTVIVIALLIASVFFAALFFRRIAAAMQRRDLLKRLKALGKDMGYSVETNKKPYSTLLPDNEYNFILRMKGRTIACRFVSSDKKSVPVYLHENGNAIYEDKKLLFSHLVTQKYAFVADEGTEKIVIICPCNGNVFIKNDREERLADSGDKCMEYRIFNASGLLNAIERGYF